jgi:hypothetical protein
MLCQVSTLHLSRVLPALFALVILEIGSCFFLARQAWTEILLFYTSHPSYDDRPVPPCTAFFFPPFEMGSH